MWWAAGLAAWLIAGVVFALAVGRFIHPEPPDLGGEPDEIDRVVAEALGLDDLPGQRVSWARPGGDRRSQAILGGRRPGMFGRRSA